MKKSLFKKFAISTLMAFGLCTITQAQAPAQSEDVMLQGFYWDSFSETKWAHLYHQADELSETFTMIWLPPSAAAEFGGSTNVGYHPYQLSNQSSSWGTAQTLKTLIQTLHDGGCKVIADIVINHRAGNSVNTFPQDNFGTYGTFQFNSSHIVSNDEARAGGHAVGTSADDGYENLTCDGVSANGAYCAARDMAHDMTYVQDYMKAYLQWMKNEMGYDGWRYDLTKGYNGWHVSNYNNAADGYYSVGEYWDGNTSALYNWVRDAQFNSTTFDFAFKYDIKNAGSNFGSMSYGGKVKGFVHSNSRYATTFIDNHDTYEKASDKYNGDWTKANALMLAAPGIPCVFWKHWTECKDDIKEMIRIRRVCGVHSESAIETTGSGTNYYSKATGKRAALICKIGDTSTPSGFKRACGGTGWAYFVPNNFDPDQPIPGSISVSADPIGGRYPDGTSVTLTSMGGEGTVNIYYTTDGSTPSASSTKYTSAISITSTTTLNFIAIDGNGNKSGISTEEYLVEAAPTKITLKFKAPNDWTACHLWAWDDAGNNLTNAGAWPGTTTMTKGADGWHSYTITNIENIDGVNFLFNNGAATGTKQTQDTRIFENSCWNYGAADSEGKYALVRNTADCNIVGIEDVITTKATIYPNPTSSTITILADKNVINAQLTSIDGKSYTIDVINNTADLSQFDKGIYIFNIKFDDNSVNTSKIVKK